MPSRRGLADLPSGCIHQPLAINRVGPQGCGPLGDQLPIMPNR